MPTLIIALVTGLLFGAGLTISQMINPAKVLNFLDLGGIATGSWDPSLAFVMAGALAVTAVGYRLAWRRARPLFAQAFQLPTRKDLDARLVTGSILFGIGWGLAGICPDRRSRPSRSVCRRASSSSPPCCLGWVPTICFSSDM
jgi:uncharacterized protein